MESEELLIRELEAYIATAHLMGAISEIIQRLSDETNETMRSLSEGAEKEKRKSKPYARIDFTTACTWCGHHLLVDRVSEDFCSEHCQTHWHGLHVN
jgi:aspartyl/asparaginyl-tRNA synthetase